MSGTEPGAAHQIHSARRDEPNPVSHTERTTRWGGTVSSAAADVQGPSDAELISAVRNGSTDAYGALYERHRSAAYNLARQLSRSPADADDLVSDAFTKVMTTLGNGGGPDSAFRAYLLTALRHSAYDRSRRERRLELAGDTTDLTASAAPESLTTPFTDTAVAGLDRTLAARAFARLPERWQAVLWHTEIEGEPPSAVAPILGMSPNAVSALAYRARERLREEFLHVHLAEVTAARCRATTERLGSWTRGTLNRRETAQVETHLDDCAQCRALAAELAEVNSALRGIIAPLILGGGVLGYLATAGAGKAVAATGLAAAGAAGAAAGSGSAGGAAAGAASSLPRQVLTAAASSAALVAAIGLALATGGHQTPAALPDPVAVVPSVAPPPSAVPEPHSPQPHSPSPNTPPPTPRPVPRPSAAPVAPPVVPQPPPPPPPPPPGQTSLAADAPQQAVQLVPNGPPGSLPITVRNGGNAPSAPPSVTLTLPPGVTATGGPATAGAPAALGARQPANAPARTATPADAPLGTAPASHVAALPPPGPATLPTPAISCSGGSGSIECHLDRGLQPGEAVVFPFTLRAGRDATGGTVTGTITAGRTVTIRVPTITVVVTPPKDAIELDATVWRDFDDSDEHARLDATVHNTGPAGWLSFDAQMPDGVLAISLDPDCTIAGRAIHCARDLARGDEFATSIWLSADEKVTGTAGVTATLGTATRHLDLPVEFDGDWDAQWWDHHDDPTPTDRPATSAPAADPSRTPISTGSTTTTRRPAPTNNPSAANGTVTPSAPTTPGRPTTTTTGPTTTAPTPTQTTPPAPPGTPTPSGPPNPPPAADTAATPALRER